MSSVPNSKQRVRGKHQLPGWVLQVFVSGGLPTVTLLLVCLPAGLRRPVTLSCAGQEWAVWRTKRLLAVPVQRESESLAGAVWQVLSADPVVRFSSSSARDHRVSILGLRHVPVFHFLCNGTLSFQRIYNVCFPVYNLVIFIHLESLSANSKIWSTTSLVLLPGFPPDFRQAALHRGRDNSILSPSFEECLALFSRRSG